MGLEAPLFYGFQRGAGKNLRAFEHLKILDVPIFADAGLQYDRSLYFHLSRQERISGSDRVRYQLGSVGRNTNLFRGVGHDGFKLSSGRRLGPRHKLVVLQIEVDGGVVRSNGLSVAPVSDHLYFQWSEDKAMAGRPRCRLRFRCEWCSDLLMLPGPRMRGRRGRGLLCSHIGRALTGYFRPG